MKSKETHMRGTIALSMMLALSSFLTLFWPATVAAQGADAQNVKSQATVRVGSIAPLPVYWPLYLAGDMGLYKKAGVTVVYTSVHNDSDCIRALVGGSLDVCTSGVDGVVRAADAGSGVRIVAGLLDKNPTFLLGTKSITSISQLRGKRLAVLSPEGGSTNAVFALLAESGLERGDYDLISVGGSSARFAALSSGQVEATILPPPNAFIAMDKGFGVLGNAAQSKHSVYGQVLAARVDVSANYNAMMKRFLGVIQEATAWLLNPANRDAAIEKLGHGTIKVDPKYASPTYELLVETYKAISPNATIDMSTVENVIRLMETYTHYTVKHPASYYVDNRYLGSPGK